MEWEAVRNFGHLFVNRQLKDGPGMRKSNAFLQNVAKSFVTIKIFGSVQITKR